MRNLTITSILFALYLSLLIPTPRHAMSNSRPAPGGSSAPVGALSINPSSGAPGIQVKITGSGFDPVAANNIVIFGNHQAVVKTASADRTMLEVIVPPDLAPGVVPVTVTVAAQTSNAVDFTVTGDSTCKFTISPTSQNFPASGGAGSVNVTAQRSSSALSLNAPQSVTAFQLGDVFAAVGQGKIKRFSPSGVLLQTLDSGSGSSETAGMAFDSAGNLYSTQFQGNSVYKFDINGTLIGPFGSGFDSHPESIVIDTAKNIYVGHANGSRLVRKFNPAGTLLDTFAPAREARGTDWIDLAADQRTLFYTSEGRYVKRFDLATKTQLADFNNKPMTGSFAYALRILPGGGVIVANTQTIVRMDTSGNIVQTYDAPGEDNWFAVNLDPDGQTFWSGNLTGGKVYRFNIATGEIVTSWDSGKFTTLAGLAVFGEITASQVLRVAKTAPTTVAPGAQLTYTISYGNTGTANAANVIIKDTVPANTSFVSATDGGIFSNGVVTWNIGTLNAGVTGRTVSFTVSVSGSLSSGTLINNNYTIEASGVTPVQGIPVTTSVTGGACNWTATSNAPWITVTSGTPGADNGTVGYSVAPNTGPARTGTITIAGLTFTVTQDAGTSSCTYSISPTSQSFAATSGSGSVNVSTQANCAWTATSNASWITITSGTPGNGSGTLNYSVAANTGPARTGTITIAGLTFTVTQSGATAGAPLIRIEPTTLNFNVGRGQASADLSSTSSRSEPDQTATTSAQPTEKERAREEEGDHVQERLEWFYRQRQYPLDRIPERARESALAERESALARLRTEATEEEAAAIAAQWTHIGPSVTSSDAWGKVSGRVSSILVHPANPNIVYIGGAQGGVWRTTDNGASWRPLTDDQPSLAMGALAFDPANPNIIYAGTGEQHFSLDSYYGNGVLKSTNGGVTWTVLGAAVFARQTIGRILVSPSSSQTVLVAASGGLYRSTDGGSTWTNVLARLATDITSGGGNTYYAAIHSDGIYKSTDGGTSWTKLTVGLPSGGFGRLHLAISTSTPNTLFASFTARDGTLEGLYRSTDGGTSWMKLVSTPNVFGRQGWYNVSLAIHPANPNIIYFGGLSLWRSQDGGATWANISNPRDYFLDVHPDQHAIAFNPQNPATIWLGCDGGVWRSDDGGNTWLSRNEGLSLTQFQSVALHPANDALAFGGTQDNGIQKYTGTSDWRETRTGDNGSTYFDFNTPTTVYTTYILGYMLKSLNSGEPGTWNTATNGIPFNKDGADNGRVAFYAPFTMDPANPQRLAFGSYRVWYTTDGMANWSAISSDVTGGGVITAITIAADGMRIWTGSNDAQVWRGDLSGGTWSWTNVRKAPLPNRFITRIAAHPTDPRIAYIAYSGFGTDHVFKTTDGGATWTSASGGLPDIPVNVVLVDPNNATTVYAGTDIGVYRSTDQGQSWTPYGTGLPNVAVFDLAIRKNSNLLRAATHGRGMWEIQTSGEQSFTIFNDGDATLTVTGITKQNNSTWLSFTTPSTIPFEIPPKGSAPVRVSINATGLNTGLFTERLLVTSNDAARSPYPTGVFINLNVTEGGGDGCTFTIAPTSQSTGASGGTGTINVTAPNGCPWTAVANDPWITITSGASGSGNGAVNYAVAANTSSARTGTIIIAGKTFTINQSGGSNCTFTIAPTSQSFNASGGTGSVNVTTQSDCRWTAASQATWISITAGASGSASGAVTYAVAANNSANTRTGALTIAGQTFTVMQSGGSNCVFTISPTNQIFSASGGTGSINVSTQSDCRWTATTSEDWIAITSGRSGIGSGTVSYVVSTNNSSVPRAGIIIVAGQIFIVAQTGTGATCGLLPISIGQTVNGALTTTDCGSPLAGPNYYADLWYFTAAAGQQVAILLTSPQFDSYVSLIGPDGSVVEDDDGGGGTNSRIPAISGFYTLPLSGTYIIEASSALTNKSGNYTLSLTAPAGCAFTIAPTSQSFNASGGTGSVSLTSQSGCAWTATSNAPWIVITSGGSGVGNGTVNYAVAANTNASSRTGTLTIAGQTFTVAQSGGSNCSFTIAPTNQSFGANGGTGSVSVTTQSSCAWTATSNASFITITANNSGTGSGTVNYTVAANNGVARTGTLQIAGQNFTVMQSGNSNCTFMLLPTSQAFAANGGDSSVSVAAPSSCSWTATSNVVWITLAAGTESGNGNGAVGYTVAPNNSSSARQGTITIADQTFTVNQSATSSTACPTISSINPTSGAVGSTVTITGANFTGVSGVKFTNNLTATITSLTDTQITLIVPTGAVSGALTLSKPGCSDVATPVFTVTSTTDCPTISSINPTSGAVGSTVTITGTNLSGATVVRFSNNVAATIITNNGTQIVTTVPAGAVTGALTLSKPGCSDVATPVFTVTAPPTARTVRVVDSSGSPGSTVSVPIELVAQGDENALGFSLTFDTAILSNPQAALGSGAAGASLNINASQTAQGRLGLALALPTGQTFAAGIRQIIVVTFTIAANTSATSTTINFGDQPIPREIVGPGANPLPATYTAGTVTLTTGFEADVAPRPNGNGTVSIADWVQVGRFAAGLDTAANGSEFQRADCAPKETKGNGAVTIADWVQAGRYAAGIDPLTSAGGPTSPAAPTAFSTTMVKAATNAVGERSLSITNARLERGQQGTVTIELEAQGNENALGFSLNFDQTQLSYLSASVGSGATGATLNINTSQVSSGRVGIALALPAGQTLAAGARQIVVVSLAVSGSGNAAPTTLSFGDQPIPREIVDVTANALPAVYTPATVLITRTTASVSAASFSAAGVASEAIVASFGLSLATTIQTATTLPLPTELAGTTVKVRDSAGTARLASLFFVAPSQVNYQIPAGTATGTATITITSGDGTVSSGTAEIAAVAPGLFAANANGQGVAAAVALRVKVDGAQIFEQVAEFNAAQNRFVARPLDLGPENEQVFLILFGTGIRYRSSLQAVSLKVGGVEAAAEYAGPAPGFVGLDQLNVRLPRSLIGRGEVDLVLMVDGKTANTVKVHIK